MCVDIIHRVECDRTDKQIRRRRRLMHQQPATGCMVTDQQTIPQIGGGESKATHTHMYSTREACKQKPTGPFQF